ncbi:hypothetical protein GJ496_010528, partial [Pomphorhynchus laevis]
MASRRQSGMSRFQRESFNNTDKHSQKASSIYVDQMHHLLASSQCHNELENSHIRHSRQIRWLHPSVVHLPINIMARTISPTVILRARMHHPC